MAFLAQSSDWALRIASRPMYAKREHFTSVCEMHTSAHKAGCREMVKDAAISVRLDARVKAAIDKAAEDDHRSTASLVEKILADWAKANGYLKR
jgi:hypothetical protein